MKSNCCLKMSPVSLSNPTMNHHDSRPDACSACTASTRLRRVLELAAFQKRRGDGVSIPTKTSGTRRDHQPAQLGVVGQVDRASVRNIISGCVRSRHSIMARRSSWCALVAYEVSSTTNTVSSSQGGAALQFGDELRGALVRGTGRSSR